MGRDLVSGLSSFLLWSSVFVSTAILSASLGYVFGQRALSGVTSPVLTSPTELAEPKEYRDPRTVPLVNDEVLITKSINLLKAPPTPTPSVPPTPTPTPKPSPSPTPTPSPTPQPSPTPTAQGSTPTPLVQATPTPTPTPTPATPKPVPTPTPPTPQISANPGAVTMQVFSVQEQGDQLVLNVAIQNNTSDVVRFLYSFMKVTDDKGRPLQVSTQGLPGDLPANGQVYQGTVRVPVASLRGAKSLSLNLSDYPSKSHQLTINGIPVPR